MSIPIVQWEVYGNKSILCQGKLHKYCVEAPGESLNLVSSKCFYRRDAGQENGLGDEMYSQRYLVIHAVRKHDHFGPRFSTTQQVVAPANLNVLNSKKAACNQMPFCNFSFAQKLPDCWGQNSCIRRTTKNFLSQIFCHGFQCLMFKIVWKWCLEFQWRFESNVMREYHFNGNLFSLVISKWN